MPKNKNNSFRNQVILATGLTAAAAAGLTAHNSTEGVTCDVPIESTISHTKQIVEDAGGDTAGARLIDQDGNPIDIVSRVPQEDLSPTVYKGDALEVQVPDRVIC